MGGIIGKTTRKKPLEQITPDTSLQRCLNVCDLTFIGLGSMIGSGIYVMVGAACKETAGPSILLSLILAAVVILMVAGCFTEFAARVQRTGSNYLYMYIILGELPAFLIGFSTLFLSILSGSTNARAWSGYLDSLFNGTISNYTMSVTGRWEVGPPLSEYPDVVAMGICIIMTIIIALGAKCSSWFTTVFVIVNVAILLFVTVLGLVYADIDNWTNKESGGFFPFGVSGVIKGSAVCFWAFSGFEILSCAVEESRNPKRDIPIATVASLLTVLVLYLGTTASLTLVTPYYTIDITAPLPSAFAIPGLSWARIIMAIGPLCGLTTTLMSSLFSFVRIAYRMSEDGLMFQWMSQLNTFSNVPVISVLVSGSIMSVLALLADISHMISFSVIILLLGYMLVCGGVIIIRYTPPNSESSAKRSESQENLLSTTSLSLEVEHPDFINLANPDPAHSSTNGSSHLRHSHHQTNGDSARLTEFDHNDSDREGASEDEDLDGAGGGHLKKSCLWLWPCNRLAPGTWPCWAVFLMSVATVLAAVMTICFTADFLQGEWWTVTVFTVSMVTLITLFITIYAYQQNLKGLIFKMPWVPLVPATAMCLCAYMTVSLAEVTHWIGIAILCALGLLIYFTYSIRHSTLNTTRLPYVKDLSDKATSTLLSHQSSDSEEEEI